LVNGELGRGDFGIEAGFDFASVSHGAANESENSFAGRFGCLDFVLGAGFDEFVVVIPFYEMKLRAYYMYEFE